MNSTAYTSTPADLLTASEELTALLFTSDIYIAYTTAKAEMEADKEARSLISEFTGWKDRYEEVQRFGKYHPDYKLVSKEIRLKKREMDVHPTVTAFKKAEKDLETLLNDISGEIAGRFLLILRCLPATHFSTMRPVEPVDAGPVVPADAARRPTA